MVYVDPKNLGYNPYWERWVTNRSSEEERELFCKLFETYVNPGLLLILEGISGVQQGPPLRTIIPQTALNMVCLYVYIFNKVK